MNNGHVQVPAFPVPLVLEVEEIQEDEHGLPAGRYVMVSVDVDARWFSPEQARAFADALLGMAARAEMRAVSS